MSLDRPRRYNLRRVVSQARRLVEDEIAKRLAYYGLRADGTTLPLGRLPHLTAEERNVRARPEAAVRKEQSDRLDRAEATARYIRNVGFTYVNRFAALRAMEVRGFLSKETLVRRPEYGGRKPRERRPDPPSRCKATRRNSRPLTWERFRWWPAANHSRLVPPQHGRKGGSCRLHYSTGARRG